jgi:phosphomannomutase
MGQENKQDDLEFDIGEDEQEATVDMNEDGSEAKLVEEEKPEVEEEEKPADEKQAAPNSEELDNYSEKVQKRIDKLTARLREHQSMPKVCRRPMNSFKSGMLRPTQSVWEKPRDALIPRY